MKNKNKIKKMLIHASLLVGLFNNINSMEEKQKTEESLFLSSPVEIQQQLPLASNFI